MLDWDPRPHPFYHLQSLKEFVADQGFPNYTFDPTQTLATLNWIESKSPEYATELRKILNFGGTVSYGNIIEQVYHTVYSWLNHDTIGGDRHLLAGIDSSDGIFDGVTLLRNVIDSLQIIRPGDTVLQAQRFSEQISNAKFHMRQGGMRAYLGEVEEYKLALVNISKPLSDAEILGRIKRATSNKHEQIDRVWHDLRVQASKTGFETTFLDAKRALIGAFTYDVPASAKSESINANFAPRNPTGKTSEDNGPYKRQRDEHGKSKTSTQNFKKRGRFPKGSCKHCPEATNHTTKYCYVEARKRRGLPDGEQWCTFHKRALHYESECRRDKTKDHLKFNKRRRNHTDFPAAKIAETVKSQIQALLTKTQHPPREARISITAPDAPTGPPAVSPPSQIFANISKLTNSEKERLKTLLQQQ